MLFFSKNKSAFIALTLLSSYSLMQGAFARLQSVRPVFSAVAGLRSFASRSHGSDQPLRLWESRQKELDALGGIPKKVQEAAHIISRDQPNISPAIHLIKRYGLYDEIAAQSNEVSKRLVSRIKFAPEVKPYIKKPIETKLKKIVSSAGIKKVTIKKRIMGHYESFNMGVNEAGEIVVGDAFLEGLPGSEIKFIQYKDDPMINDLIKKMNFDIFAGVFLHELGHIHQQHFLAISRAVEQKQITMTDLKMMGNYFEREADAFVVSYGDLQFVKGSLLYEESLSLSPYENAIEEDRLLVFGEKEGRRLCMLMSHPSVYERIAFFSRELAFMQQQEAVKNR